MVVNRNGAASRTRGCTRSVYTLWILTGDRDGGHEFYFHTATGRVSDERLQGLHFLVPTYSCQWAARS